MKEDITGGGYGGKARSLNCFKSIQFTGFARIRKQFLPRIRPEAHHTTDFQFRKAVTDAAQNTGQVITQRNNRLPRLRGICQIKNEEIGILTGRVSHILVFHTFSIHFLF